MASYSEFLKLLQEIPKPPSSSLPPSLSPLQTYEQLCYDFPQVAVDELAALRSEFGREVEKGEYSSFPITNKFLQGIAYGASKYGNSTNTNNINIASKNTDTKNSTDPKNNNNSKTNAEKNNLQTNTNNNANTNPFYEQYSSLNAVALVKFVRNALSASQEDLDKMLSKYFVETEHDGDVTENPDEVIARMMQNNKEESAPQTNIAAEQDGDNYVYEDYTGAEPEPLANHQTTEVSDEITGDWDHLSRKLTQLCSTLSYDKLAHENTWTDLEIFPDVAEIVRLIKAHTFLNLASVLPHWVFLLRDRMLDKPLLIRSMLPTCIDILELKDGTIQNTDAQLGVSIFASFVTQKMPNSAAEGLAEIISQNLNFFEQRMACICELKPQELISLDCTNELRGISHVLKWYAQYYTKKGTKNVETEFLQNGIIRDLVALFVRFGALDELADPRQFLLFLSTQFNKISQFLQQVPPHVAQLTEDSELQQHFSEEVLVWALSFHIHPVPDVDTPIKWLDLAEKFTNDILPNPGETKGEWLQDSTLVYKIHTLLSLLLPLREVRFPPTSESSVKSLLAPGCFLGDKLRGFQKEVELLFKATTVVGKDDISQEGKRKRKVQKKQHSTLAKLQNLLKGLLEEQSKKD